MANLRLLREEVKKQAVVGILAAEGGEVHKPSTREKKKDDATRAFIKDVDKIRVSAKFEVNLTEASNIRRWTKDLKDSARARIKERKAKRAAGGLTVLQVAQWMEFGTATAPARPFIRGYADKYGKRIREYVKEAVRAAATGKGDPLKILPRIGLTAVAGMQTFIRNEGEGTYPPNADSTIANKGSSVPLIDTGQLRSSITFDVRLRSK